MNQLKFGFVLEIKEEVDIELCTEVKNALIKQMAIAILKVSSRGKSKNDDATIE